MLNYTSTISHEFRTPVGTSLMFLEQMLEQNLSPQVKEMLQVVVCQLNLLMSLVNGVIDVSSIESRTYKAKKVIFQPLSVLDMIMSMFKM